MGKIAFHCLQLLLVSRILDFTGLVTHLLILSGVSICFTFELIMYAFAVLCAPIIQDEEITIFLPSRNSVPYKLKITPDCTYTIIFPTGLIISICRTTFLRFFVLDLILFMCDI